MELCSLCYLAILFASLLPVGLADERFYERGSDVVMLKTVKDFKARVSNSSFLWVLQLYREGCGFCKLLEKEYNEVATDLKHIVYFGSIDTERAQALVSAVTRKYSFKVEGVPTVVMISPGKSVAQDYRGERTAKALRSAAYNAMPSFVVVLTLAKLDAWLAESSQPTRKVVLFSAKATVTPLLKALSSAYKGRIQIAQVTSDISDLQRFGVKQLPTLVVFKRRADDFESARWLADKFPTGNSVALTWAAGVKPSFRKVEGWLMAYSRVPKPATKRSEL